MQRDPQIIHRIIRLLVESPQKRIDIARITEKSTRTVSRYFEKIEELGYLIDKDQYGRYFIFGGDEFRNRKFSPEERTFIANALNVVNDGNPLRKAILEKLNCPELPIPGSDSLELQIKAKNFENLQWAIDHKVTVILKNFFSAQGKEEYSDRRVNPLYFLYEGTKVYAYEPAARKGKSFSLDRIGRVELTDQCFEEKQAKALFTDPFGFTGTHTLPVKLILKPFAGQLLIENHPMAEPYIEKGKEKWIFNGKVCDYRGIGRFILGLPGEIRINDNPALIAYLKERILEYNF